MTARHPPHRLALSVDLDEWYHSRRWVDGVQARAVPENAALFRRLYGQESPIGEIVAPTRALLELFTRHQCRATFFILGEVVEFYPELIEEIASNGHELACHGMHHVDMTVLGPGQFAHQLDGAARILEAVSGKRPRGYRAPNLVYEPWATRILEDCGFVYDSTVCVSRSIGGKYEGWANVPMHPYHPSYDDVSRPGAASLIEVPLPSFPVLKLSAGSGIMTRLLGLTWTLTALRHAIANGNTAYYFHPWEVGSKPRADGHPVRNASFLRRTGPWMLRAADQILGQFAGRIITSGESAASVAAHG